MLMTREFFTRFKKSLQHPAPAVFILLVLSGLYLTSFYNYVLFHCLAETFSIVIACGVFIFAWNSRRFLDNDYFLFLGIAYLFVAGLDTVHMLAYKGMHIFDEHGPNLPTQLWIAARYLESLSLLLAPVFLTRKLNVQGAFIGYLAVFVILLWAIFSRQLFPDCFLAESGLTPFKKISEYIISCILLGSLLILQHKRDLFHLQVFRLLMASVAITIASELAFTFYVSVYGLSNMIGHYLKIISFYLIYKAVIETGLMKPHEMLFGNLLQSEENLKRANRKLRLLADRLEQMDEKLRRRTAKELHDRAAQNLSALSINLSMIKLLLPQKETEKINERLEDSRKLVKNTIKQIRHVMADLHPSILDDYGLMAALCALTDQFEGRTGIATVAPRKDLSQRLSRKKESALFRIAQEALSNIAKHAGAREVRVEMTEQNGTVRLIIKDDGVGFDPALIRKPDGHHMGLAIMKERTTAVQGKFHIASSPDTGTTLTVTLRK